MSKGFVVLAVLVLAVPILSAQTAFAGAREEMMAADRAFAAAAQKEGAHAAFLDYMTDDVLLYDGDHPPIVGKKAAAAYYTKLEAANPASKASKLNWEPTGADASADGTFGSTQGRWTLAAKKKDGSPLALKGYYVTEWRKQKDGSWKFSLDIGGTD